MEPLRSLHALASAAPPASPGLARVTLRPAAPHRVPPPAPVRTEAWAVAAILALAAALRLRGLWAFPLEQDEIYTVLEGRYLWDVALRPGIHARPLYFLQQHVMLGVLPETEAGLRLVPLLFGMAGIWAVWRLGRHVFGPAAGVTAAFLAALSPWHLYASGMARYWTLLFLLSAAYQLGVCRAYGSGRARDYRWTLVPLLLGSATHPSFLFPAAGVALGVTLVREDGRLGWRWPSRTAWVDLWGPYALLLVIAVVALRSSGNGAAVQNWSGRGWLASLRLLPGIADWATPTLAFAGTLGAAAAMGLRDPTRRRWGAMALAGGAVTGAGLLAASLRTDVYADYAIGILPLLLVSAGGLVQLGVERMREGARPAGMAAAAVMAVGMLPATASHLSDGTRFDYRPALLHVRRTAAEVPVAVWPIAVARRYAPTLDHRDLPLAGDGLERLLAAEGDLWVVASIRRYGLNADDGGTATAWLARRCVLSGSWERPRWDYRVHRVHLYRCRLGAG